MSCSKPLPPFNFDVLYYFNRDQLERFSIVCRPLKNFIDRYFSSKPYRVFDELRIIGFVEWINGGSYALFNNDVRWHPNRDDYSVQQFLGAHECIDKQWILERILEDLESDTCYSFADMRPYLGLNIRINEMSIWADRGSTYNSEQVKEMESIAYLWRDGDINILDVKDEDSHTVAEEFLPILNSPTILQCRKLFMRFASFSFKDYKVLYDVKIIVIDYSGRFQDEIDLWQQHWPQFFEHSGFKPMVVFRSSGRKNVKILQDQLSKAFSSAVLPNAFKIVFDKDEPLTEFRKTNEVSGDKLELKLGFPAGYRADNFDEDRCSILECSSI